MPKKARAAREQPSPGPTPSVNAPVADDGVGLEAVPMKPPPLDPRIGLLLELFKNNGFSRKTLFLYHYQP